MHQSKTMTIFDLYENSMKACGTSHFLENDLMYLCCEDNVDFYGYSYYPRTLIKIKNITHYVLYGNDDE